MEKPRKRPPRAGEGRPPLPIELKRDTRLVRVGNDWADYIQEQAGRRGESMGQFVEHVLALYKDNPAIL